MAHTNSRSESLLSWSASAKIQICASSCAGSCVKSKTERASTPSTKPSPSTSAFRKRPSYLVSSCGLTCHAEPALPRAASAAESQSSSSLLRASELLGEPGRRVAPFVDSLGAPRAAAKSPSPAAGVGSVPVTVRRCFNSLISSRRPSTSRSRSPSEARPLPDLSGDAASCWPSPKPQVAPPAPGVAAPSLRARDSGGNAQSTSMTLLKAGGCCTSTEADVAARGRAHSTSSASRDDMQSCELCLRLPMLTPGECGSPDCVNTFGGRAQLSTSSCPLRPGLAQAPALAGDGKRDLIGIDVWPAPCSGERPHLPAIGIFPQGQEFCASCGADAGGGCETGSPGAPIPACMWAASGGNGGGLTPG
mmetsp:Transcript_55077/g.118989  ORF Transcript_55077/g.118989 Transcript_55077/m.118989 type:complete len:363 (-) Transcript_55077:91-1179(-)